MLSSRAACGNVWGVRRPMRGAGGADLGTRAELSGVKDSTFAGCFMLVCSHGHGTASCGQGQTAKQPARWAKQPRRNCASISLASGCGGRFGGLEFQR